MWITTTFSGDLTDETYDTTYRHLANEARNRHSLHPDIPLLGQKADDPAPHTLPWPDTDENTQTLRERLDAFAVAAGLPQTMIDAAESG